MPRTAGLPLVVALAAAVATGCGGTGPADGSPPSGPSPSASAASAPPPSPAAPSATTGVAATLPLVAYGKQGGIAGVDDRLTISPGGAYEISRHGREARRGTLPPAELAEVTAALREARFADIPSVNSGGGIADGFTYYVAYDGHAVMAEDGAVPAALEPVLAALEGVLTRHGG